MSSDLLAIAARNIGKSYAIRRAAPPPTTLAEAIVKRLRRPFNRGAAERFWALRDVSFDVNRGEIIGLIGRNGAGKSTLLKLLSRITSLSDGEINLFGRVGSLLEVGTGFHQELTGRENIFLAGAIQGMTRAEIRRQFDEIVAFAAVERFLDTPVKRYSSGMYVRLAFAVAAHLRSEILLVDEVLAVGDAEFQRKCLGKIKGIAGDGRTIVLVSHNMQSIQAICTRALVLDAGRCAFDGATVDAIAAYARIGSAAMETPAVSHNRFGSGEYRFTSARSLRPSFAPAETKTIEFRLERAPGGGDLGRFYPSASIVNADGIEIARLDGRFVGAWLDDADRYAGTLEIHSPWLPPGVYAVDLYICTGNGIVDQLRAATSFEVSEMLPYPQGASHTATQGVLVLADFNWTAAAERAADRSSGGTA